MCWISSNVLPLLLVTSIETVSVLPEGILTPEVLFASCRACSKLVYGCEQEALISYDNKTKFVSASWQSIITCACLRYRRAQTRIPPQSSV